MKIALEKVFWAAALIALLASASCQKKAGQAVAFQPEKPRPGQTVLVRYRPAGTPLEKAAAVEMMAYFYVKGAPRAQSIPMSRKGSEWQASLASRAEERGVILKFQSGQAIDTNARKGYVLPFYDSQGNHVPGYKAGLAEAISGWGNILAGLVVSRLQALQMLEEEFAAHTRVKSDYLAVYFTLVSRIKPRDSRQIILGELAQLAANPQPSADELALLVNFYTQMQMPDQANRFSQALVKAEPKGRQVQAQRFQALAQEPDLKKKLALVEAFQKDFPGSAILGQVHYSLITAFLEKGKSRQAKDFLDAHPSDASWALYNALAWGLIGLSQSPDLNLAEAASLQAVALARRNKDSSDLPKPPYLTDKEWAEQKGSALGEALDTLGVIQLRMRRADQALSPLKEAALLLSEKNATVNEHYGEALLQAAPPDKTLGELRRILSERHGSPRLKEILKAAYLAEKGSDRGFPEFLSEIEAVAREKLRADLQAKLLDEAAPDLSLANLTGDIISLAGLRGRVVVVDFWASWCQPCLDSFPGMKRTVENLRNDRGVRFLFINSWERVADRKQNAADFLAAHNYPFEVLLDLQDKVIAAFQVEAIPTQFIIDGRGRIRFQNEGFPGNVEDQVEELAMMIDIVR